MTYDGLLPMQQPLLFIHLQNPPCFLDHFFSDPFRAADFHAFSQGHDPAQELVADIHFYGQGYGIGPLGDQHDIFAEPIDENAYFFILDFQLYFRLFPIEHAEMDVGILGDVQFPEGCFSFSGQILQQAADP